MDNHHSSFETDSFYHVFNRAVGNELLFRNENFFYSFFGK